MLRKSKPASLLAGFAMSAVFSCAAMSQTAPIPSWSQTITNDSPQPVHHTLLMATASADPHTGQIYLAGDGFMRLSGSGDIEVMAGPDLHLDPPTMYSINWSIVATDGDLIMGLPSCQIFKFTPNGHRRWSWKSTVQPNSCKVQKPFSDGSLYALERDATTGTQSNLRLLRILTDGTQRTVGNWHIPAATTTDMAVSERPGENLVDIRYQEESSFRLIRVDRGGQLQWIHTIRGLNQVESTAGSNGSTVLVGTMNNQLFHITIDSDGREIRRSVLPLQHGTIHAFAFPSDNGRIFVVESDGHNRLVRVLDQELDEITRVATADFSCNGDAKPCRAWIEPNGDLVLTSGSEWREDAVERFDLDGNLRFQYRFLVAPNSDPLSVQRRIHSLGDNRLLHIHRLRADQVFNGVMPRIEIVTETGQSSGAITLPVTPTSNSIDPPRSLTTPDGWTFTLTNGASSKLVAIDPQGRSQWTQPVAGPNAYNNTYLLANCGNGVAMIETTGQVACRERSDGRLRWRTLGGTGPWAWTLASFDNGNVLAYERDQVWLLDSADGRILWHRECCGTPFALHPTQGAAFVDGSGFLRRLTPQGTLIDLSPPNISHDFRASALDSLGGLTLAAPASDATPGGAWSRSVSIKRIEDRRLMWSHTIPFHMNLREVMDVHVTDDGSTLLHVAGYPPESTDYHRNHVLIHLDRTGAETWRRTWARSSLTSQRIVGVHNNRILLSSNRANTGDLVLMILDGSTGSTHRELRIPCDLSCSTWYVNSDEISSLVAMDGSGAIVVTDSISGAMGSHILVQKHANAFLDNDSLPLGQPIVDGHWHPIYSAGQGFLVKWIPAYNTIFMPWFTYSTSGQNDPAELRWYLVQGQIDPNDELALLPMYSLSSGQFGLPGSSMTEVGTALIRMDDCNNLALEFEFVAPHNEGATNSVALTRTLPSQVPCPSSGNNGSLPAYDAAITGVWFDPDTAGQGLAIQRVASSAGSPGFLFGSWYAFDNLTPDGDSRDQHWFTIQGQATTDSLIRSTIYQSIGGQLDVTGTLNHTPVGEVTISSLACDRLRISYRFADLDEAGAFRSAEGEMDLHRIGDCQ